jgi:hypothetical protein
LKYKCQKKPKRKRHVSIISKHHLGHMQLRDLYHVHNQTTAGHIAQNEMDTHADTCCAGTNWSLMELTGDICDINPFLDLYQLISEIPVA